MDDDRAHALVAKLVDEDSLLEDEVGELVLAAFGGPEVVALLIDGGDVPELDGRTPPVPLGAYVTSIAVEGFRGVGQQATLEIEPGPGLTLIVGRNGSGKSTFAEGLEVLLTGDNKRWSTRSMVWREGWRNLHHSTAALEATLAVEGRPGVTVVRRTWPDGAGLEESSVEVQSTGLKKSSLGALGWDEALINFRPFLSYNELGSMLDEGPSKLHDAITRVLGLDDLSAAEKTLRDVRLERERALKDVMGQRPEIVEGLEALDDDRARACIAALRGSQINYEIAEQAIATGAGRDEGGEIVVLQCVAGCEVPNQDRIRTVAQHIRAAVERVADLAGTQSDELLRSAVLLETAAAFRTDYPDDRCPVCETKGVITDEWMQQASEQAQRQREAADEASAALSTLEASQREGRSLIADFPTNLRAVEKLADIRAVLAVWGDWLGLRDERDPLRLADGLEATIEPLHTELEKVKEQGGRTSPRARGSVVPGGFGANAVACARASGGTGRCRYTVFEEGRGLAKEGRSRDSERALRPDSGRSG
jgi:energy-coupling factor transporter ATP-binding protein EcfA2